MREIERIDRVLNKIRQIWELNPDLRLGQLLTICSLQFGDNIFYTEDSVLEESLDNFIEGLSGAHGFDSDDEADVASR